jgi:hypothetical protein
MVRLTAVIAGSTTMKSSRHEVAAVVSVEVVDGTTTVRVSSPLSPEDQVILTTTEQAVAEWSLDVLRQIAAVDIVHNHVADMGGGGGGKSRLNI